MTSNADLLVLCRKIIADCERENIRDERVILAVSEFRKAVEAAAKMEEAEAPTPLHTEHHRN